MIGGTWSEGMPANLQEDPRRWEAMGRPSISAREQLRAMTVLHDRRRMV